MSIFINEDSVIRLVGMVLADNNDEWITDERHHHLSEGSMALLLPWRDHERFAAITGGEA